MPKDNIVEMLQELEENFPRGVLNWIMHPVLWFTFKLTIAQQEYRKYLKSYVWSPLRKKLFPWLLHHGRKLRL